MVVWPFTNMKFIFIYKNDVYRCIGSASSDALSDAPSYSNLCCEERQCKVCTEAVGGKTKKRIGEDLRGFARKISISLRQ